MIKDYYENNKKFFMEKNNYIEKNFLMKYQSM